MGKLRHGVRALTCLTSCRQGVLNSAVSEPTQKGRKLVTEGFSLGLCFLFVFLYIFIYLTAPVLRCDTWDL